jgi:hypothetical protein
MRLTLVILGSALLGLGLGMTGDAQFQDPRRDNGGFQADVQEGIEVQTRGPVHEAFAQPVARDPEPTRVIEKQPPEPVPELPPDLKPEGEESVWIPGYWAWEDDREDFLWVSGTWRVPPPDRTWVPGYWAELDGGWQWVPGYWAAEVQVEAEAVLYPEPPDPIEEAIPPPQEEGVSWVPGHWVYRTTRYWWTPGYYMHHRPGWVWVNPCYYWTPGGYVYTAGYWDLDIHRRGMLFSPVFFQRPLWNQAGWYYRPYYAVHRDFLFTSLFVGTGYRHYYFGDYYEPRYARLGIYPWFSVSFGRSRYHDPLWDYYRWRYRDQPRWADNIRTVYDARREGRQPRPPRTFREQQQLIARGGDVNVQVSVPIRQITKVDNTVKLRQVNKTELQQAQKTSQQIQRVRLDRTKMEAKARAGGKREQPVKMDLPRAQLRTEGAVRPKDVPPRPKTPQAVEREIPKRKDVDVTRPKGKDTDVTRPKGKDTDVTRPKGKDVDVAPPKGKPLPPKKNVDVTPPKGKPLPPKGKDIEPATRPKDKPRDVDAPRPKDIPKKGNIDDLPPVRPRDVDVPRTKPLPPKDRDVPKKRDIDDLPPVRPRDVDVPRTKPLPPRDVEVPKAPRPRDVPDVRPRDIPPREAPRPPEARPDRPDRPDRDDRPQPAPRGKGKDRKDRD